MLGLAFSKFFTHAFHASCEVAEVRTRMVVACACWRDAVAAPVTRSAVSATAATVAARARVRVDDITYLLCYADSGAGGSERPIAIAAAEPAAAAASAAAAVAVPERSMPSASSRE